MFFTCVIYFVSNLELLFTLTKEIDGRKSNWRFVKNDDGLCAIGGNYKLLQYRNTAGMNKSRDWFLAHGYAIAK